VDPALAAGSTYSWRARAVALDGTAGQWSESAMFVVSGGNPSSSGCGCATGGSGIPLVVGLGFLIALRQLGRRENRKARP
jgi:MYXO-CTERM domain-containing protein